jgi:hypothetical protein
MLGGMKSPEVGAREVLKKKSKPRLRPDASAAEQVSKLEDVSPATQDKPELGEQTVARAEPTADEASVNSPDASHAANGETRSEDAHASSFDPHFPTDTGSTPAPIEPTSDIPTLPIDLESILPDPSDPGREESEPALAEHPVVAAPSPSIATANLPVAIPAAPLATLVLPAAPAAMAVPDSAGLPLEERVRRLEAALAQLQGGAGHEPRQAEQIRVHPTQSTGTTSFLLDVGKRLLRPSEPKLPNPATAPAAASAPPGTAARTWLLLDAIAEARAIFRMFVDPRYRLSWFGRTVPLCLIGAIATSWWWVPGSSILIFGTLLDKSVDLVLAFFLFKVLSHEARRYRETSPDLPQNLRL